MTASNADVLQQLSDARRAVASKPALPPEAEPIEPPVDTSTDDHEEDQSVDPPKTTAAPRSAAKLPPKAVKA